MIGHLMRRAGVAVLLVWGAATLVFLMVEAAPGDPFSMDDSPAIDPLRARELRARYGLDRPALERYLLWLGGAAGGDWGVSLLARRPVSERVREALPFSILLGLASLGTAVAVGGAVGVLQGRLREAKRMGIALERQVDRLALVLYCLPTFWVGLGLIEIFSYRLGWLPPSHLVPAGAMAPVGLEGAFRHWILPVITLALAPGAAIARHLRTSLLESRAEGFLWAARARGAGPIAVLTRHRLRACLGPALALVGLHLPHVAGGALLVEVVFALPGIGRLGYEAMLGRDTPMLMAITVLVSACVALGGLLTDLAQAWADPRMRALNRKAQG